MKITLEYLKQIIAEAIAEVSHDTAADGVESMQHDLEEEERPKSKNNKNKKRKKRKSC